MVTALASSLPVPTLALLLKGLFALIGGFAGLAAAALPALLLAVCAAALGMALWVSTEEFWELLGGVQAGGGLMLGGWVGGWIRGCEGCLGGGFPVIRV